MAAEVWLTAHKSPPKYSDSPAEQPNIVKNSNPNSH